jgi:hypothetical protein
MEKITTFISLSGGIDSTYYLWKWLTENKTETILVHHCQYFSYDKNRGQNEQLAMGKILGWLKDNGLSNFIYKQTTWGDMPYPYHDIVGVSVPAGLLCRQYPTITTILLPYWYPEIQKIKHWLTPEGRLINISPRPNHRFQAALNVFNLMAGQRDGNPLNHSIRYHKKRKHQMIAEMPNDLLALTWFCRRPKGNHICRTCDSCLNIIPELTKAEKLHVFA